MLLSTHNILKRKLGENLEQNNHKRFNGSVSRSKSDMLAPPNSQNKLYQNGLFNNPAENQKDFVIVKFSDGCNAKVSHACITKRSIVKDDDLFGEIKKGQSCKVMFHDKILAAIVICKGSKEILTQHLETFCENFDQEQGTTKKCDVKQTECKKGLSKREQLNNLQKEIQEKDLELTSLRKKYEDLKKKDDVIKINGAIDDTSITSQIIENKTLKEDDSLKTVSSLPKDSIGEKVKPISENKAVMDSEYPLIPAIVKEKIVNLAKDKTKKDPFLFRYCFVNSFKDQEKFFLENSFQNMTPEYTQFIEMVLKLIKSIRPNVKRSACHQMVSQLHCEAKRKFKLLSRRKKYTEKLLATTKANLNKSTNGAISPGSNRLIDNVERDILEANTAKKHEQIIDYILLDD